MLVTANIAVAGKKKISLEPEAEQYFTIAKELEAKGDYKSIRKLRSKAVKPLSKIADEYGQSKRYDEAIEIYQRLYEIQKRHYGEHSRKTQRFLSKIAYINQLAGRYSEQARLEQGMLDNREKITGGTDAKSLKLLMSLAFTYKQGRAYTKSEALYLKAIKIHEEKNMTHRHTYNKLLYELASLYIDKGDYAKAEPYYRRSLNIKEGEEIQVTTRNITRMFNYAFMLQFSGRLDDAEALYKKMLVVAKSNPANFGPYTQEPQVRGNFGALYRQMGDYDKALKLSHSTYEDYKKGFGKHHAITLYAQNNLAETYLAMRQYEKALPLLEEAVEVLQKQVKLPNQPYVDKNYVIPNLALTYAKLSDHGRAEKLFRKVISELTEDYSQGHPLVTYSQVNLAESYYQQGRLQEAANLCLQALVHAINNKSPYLLAKIYFTLAKVRQKQGLLAEAIFYGKQGVNKLQQIRAGLLTTEKALQAKFIESQQKNYEVLAGWLVDAGRLSEAEQVLAMLKEEEYFHFIRRNATTEGLTQAQLNSLEIRQQEKLIHSSSDMVKLANEFMDYQNTDPKLINEKDKLQIKKLKTQLLQAEKTFQETLAEIKKAFGSGNKGDLITQLEDASYAKLVKDLGDDVALIHFLPLQDGLRIILRTSRLNTAKKVNIPARQFNQLVNDYRMKFTVEDVTNTSKKELLTLSKQLYQWLIQPVALVLQQANIKTLMLYKNGSMRYIPLATLHDGKKYLVERYALSSYTAAATDSFMVKQSVGWTIAGMGVSKQFGKFAPLHMVKDELDGIIKTNDRDKKGVYRGAVYVNEAFTPTQFKINMQSGFNVGHVATHYKFMPGTEADSFLLMGDGSHLTLADLRRAKYNFQKIDLLTLSACETAVSDSTSDGREVEGLATLVQRLGAKAVIATLWPVTDCSTGQFMQLFYQHRSSGLNKAAALRQSQLDFIQNRVPMMAVKPKQHDKGCQLLVGDLAGEYQHPYYWAPFILMGNWR